ncbi:MAG: hypothetical protein JXB62_09905 [Pirellulales bacterium]|nr:hypothetical protein [Pirellulales bacterium]
MVYRPSAASILETLSNAHLSERNAASSQLSREVLLREDPQASLPEEFSDKAVVDYLINAGSLYADAAVDYILISDPARAYKYFRKAMLNCRKAVQLSGNNSVELGEKVREYADRAALMRQKVAQKNIRRRRLSLGLLSRPR